MDKSAIPPDLTSVCNDMALDEKALRLHAVETLVQYRFHNRELLWEALQGPPAFVTPDGNKRLAIVGDAAIRLVLAEDWYPGRTSKSKIPYHQRWQTFPTDAGSRKLQQYRHSCGF